MLNQVIDRLANGAAFEAQVRQRVWTAGHTVVGVGAYQQSGAGSGRFHLQITMHDGEGKHTMQQISDGRLTWTRTQVGDNVRLQRVDVGWLEEGVRASGGMIDLENRQNGRTLTPRMRIGAWTEMLDRLQDDYLLRIGTSKLNSQSLYVISGQLSPKKRAEIDALVNGGTWPELYPTRVNVAVALSDDPETGFGAGLPVRIEFWSDPIVSESSNDDEGDSDEGAVAEVAGETQPDSATSKPSSVGRMVSLIEIYSPRQIQPPTVEHFRFTNDDATIEIINETARYEKRFGIRVSAKERARQRW